MAKSTTTSFYAPPELISGDRLSLPDDEARHASKALRVSAGDEIMAVDGQGGWYRVAVSYADRKTVTGDIVERRRGVGEPSYHLTIAIGLLKQRARFETFLEKAAELGVSEVVPLITERTERDQIRFDRSESKLIAAMKQCGRSKLVTLSEPVTLDVYVEATALELAICCHERTEQNQHLRGILDAAARPQKVAVMVGPEGGFSDAEVDLAQTNGWQTAFLGRRRLRAETAAIAAAVAVAFRYESA